MFKKILILLILILTQKNISYSNEIREWPPLKNAKSFTDVIKCIKKQINNMDSDDAQNYCMTKNLSYGGPYDVGLLIRQQSGWWKSEGSNLYNEFRIRVNKNYPNMIIDSITFTLHHNNDEKTSHTVRGLFLWENKLKKEFVSLRYYDMDFGVNFSKQNISSQDIKSWSLDEIGFIKVVDYEHSLSLFRDANLGDLKKCEKIYYSLLEKNNFKEMKKIIRDACSEVISKTIDLNKFLDTKILKSNDKIGLSVTSKYDNKFVVTGMNIKISYENCDKDKIEKNSKNPLERYKKYLPYHAVNKFNYGTVFYLMPGKTFESKLVNMSADDKYCNKSIKIDKGQIINIE